MNVPEARGEILRAIGRFESGVDPEQLYLEPEVEVYYTNPVELHADLNWLVRDGTLRRHESPGRVRYDVSPPIITPPDTATRVRADKA